MKPATFYSSCVGFPHDKIDDFHAMVDGAVNVSASTFRRNIGTDAYRELSESLGYVRGESLTLASDWAVSFYRSELFGKTAYYVKHSGIEYIYLKEPLPC